MNLGATAGGRLGFGRDFAGFGEVLEPLDESFDVLLQPFYDFGREIGALVEDGLQQTQE